jgi:DNA repair protein RadC
LLSHGPSALSLAELIAILLGTGTDKENVMEVARGLVNSLENIPMQEINVAELKNRRGVGESKATRILAAIELGRRMNSISVSDSPILNTSQKAYDYLRPKLAQRTKEVFAVISLDVRNRPISYDEIDNGSSESVTFFTKDLFQIPIRVGAAGILCAHNHPSGDVNPSKEDFFLTDRIIKVSKDLGIRFLDHLIISSNQFFSFANNNLQNSTI